MFGCCSHSLPLSAITFDGHKIWSRTSHKDGYACKPKPSRTIHPTGRSMPGWTPRVLRNGNLIKLFLTPVVKTAGNFPLLDHCHTLRFSNILKGLVRENVFILFLDFSRLNYCYMDYSITSTMPTRLLTGQILLILNPALVIRSLISDAVLSIPLFSAIIIIPSTWLYWHQ